jgi:hypothetical protein
VANGVDAAEASTLAATHPGLGCRVRRAQRNGSMIQIAFRGTRPGRAGGWNIHAPEVDLSGAPGKIGNR